jgi:glucose/arabinose dehydrogenase
MKKSITISAFIFIALILLSNTLFSPPPANKYFYGVFPSSAPGIGGSYALEEVSSGLDIASPLRIIDFPNSEDYLLLSKTGLIYKVNFEEEKSEIVLDIKDRTFKLGEGGSVGMILHPDFNSEGSENNYILVFYRYKPNPDEWSKKGFNRLSKFYWDESLGIFDTNSEEILIQQYDRTEWHNGGGMTFGRDGFLYLSIGDEGHQDYISTSTQRLDGGMFSGLLRIDVDNDPTKSHPIRRQPTDNGDAPDGWGETYTQGYSIPNDNPWVSEDGSTLEEFWAIGLRSPYSMYLDEETENIWIADVGEAEREEVNLVEKGDNLQWPYREGSQKHVIHDKPEDLIGNEKSPFHEYGRTEGTCIIGGAIYRGERHEELFDRYIYADYTHNKLVSINSILGADPDPQTIIGDVKSFGLDLPAKSGITGLQIRENGEILVFISNTEDFLQPGRILRLVQNSMISDPPSKLSSLGVFEDLDLLKIKDDFVPYSVNSPLWSDRAEKKRWMLIPSDGNRNSNEEKISFSKSDGWKFPEGTVFVKHFALPLSLDDPDKLQ